MGIEGIPPPIGGSEPPPIGEPPPTPPPEPPPEDTLEAQIELDDSLKLFVTRGITLPPGRISLTELTALINAVIQKLRQAIRDSEFLDTEISREFHLSIIGTALSLEALHSELVNIVEGWKDSVKPGGLSIPAAYGDLLDATEEYNAFMEGVWQDDLTVIPDLNDVYEEYNNLTPARIQQIYDDLSQEERDALLEGLTQEEIDAMGGEVQAVVIQLFNSQISPFNNHAASRPDLFSEILFITELTNTYNLAIDQANTSIAATNESRETYGFAPISFYQNTFDASPVVANLTLDEQPLITGPLIPATDEERLALFVQSPTVARTTALREALLDVPDLTAEIVDSAIEEAVENGPFETEAAFFAAIRDAIAAQFDPPQDGIDKFYEALATIPIRGEVKVPTQLDNGTISNPLYPGDEPVLTYTEMLSVHWVPVAEITLAYLQAFNDILDLSNEYLATQSVLLNAMGMKLNLIAPYGLFDRVDSILLSEISTAGGVGMAAFAMGLHSRTLEIALSHAIFRTIAQNFSFPISGRLFARLQFSALELISRSSLLSVFPALRFLASRLGFLGAESPVILGAIALGLNGQIVGLITSNVLHTLVNGQISSLAFYARREFRKALRGEVNAQQQLRNAQLSGDPVQIENALTALAEARTVLAEKTLLFNAFGATSFGEMGSFANSVTAALNLSLLGISMAQFARALGLPYLAPVMFAQLSQLSSIDILSTLTAGSSLMDVLDNPISMLAIKQTLVDTLVYRLGYNSSTAAVLINQAINGVIFSGHGIQSISRLQAELAAQFLTAGFTQFQATLLANETIALIRGDLGATYLNAAFGLNVDRSTIASSLADNLFGLDAGLAGSMLSNAIVRSLLYGGFGSTVRLQSELIESYQTLGLDLEGATALANQTLAFLETVGMAIPFNRYPGLVDALLGDPILNAIVSGTGVVREELLEDLQMRGLSTTEAEYLADQLLALINGEFSRGSDAILFELALNSAINRVLLSGATFDTERDFRDKLVDELRGVGFSRQDAYFLANSSVFLALNLGLPSFYGASAERIAAINSSLIDQIASETGIPRSQAEEIVSTASANTLGKGPYSSEDEYKNVLKEEIFQGVLSATGRDDGNALFDRAIAGLADTSQLLGLGGLMELISGQALGLFRSDLGSRLAQELRDQILVSLLGGKTVDEVDDAERQNPLSILNQINDQLESLTKGEETAELIKMLRKLIQLLQALTTPNASIAYLLRSLTDNPGTFFNAANSSIGSDNYQATQIVV